ncbi:MAG: acetyl-CoA carboxylase biotin carboxylase subunit [Pseudomonadota bacterium]
MFKKILIANRGEIALRVLRACREMGIPGVVVYSDADKDSLPVRLADEAVHIGPALSRKSYLDREKIIQAALSVGADAVHPGYGFLSEDPAFAGACADNGLTFIGPSPEAIAMAGNKSAARRRLEELGIPTIPGSDGIIADSKSAVSVAEGIGYPVILKAAGGGGGRGMRVANDPEALRSAFATASGEARAAFGAPDLYLEKYIDTPRHIEIQILADTRGACIHLGERECSIQHRYQKLIEESPSPFVGAALRARMGETAVSAARAIGYTNAGTMEFLVDAQGRFYFMEINARVQVEHPVTEMVTGVDIVQEQIRIAAGEPLSARQAEIMLRGWSMECRINAADPENGFMPSPGEVRSMRLPAGPGVRVDTHLFAGALVPPFYDSLVCKLAVWATDRPAAIARMQRALGEMSIEGIHTTTAFHQKVFADADFCSGRIDTHFLDRKHF